MTILCAAVSSFKLLFQASLICFSLGIHDLFQHEEVDGPRRPPNSSSRCGLAEHGK